MLISFIAKINLQKQSSKRKKRLKYSDNCTSKKGNWRALVLSKTIQPKSRRFLRLSKQQSRFKATSQKTSKEKRKSRRDIKLSRKSWARPKYFWSNPRRQPRVNPCSLNTYIASCYRENRRGWQSMSSFSAKGDQQSFRRKNCWKWPSSWSRSTLEKFLRVLWKDSSWPTSSSAWCFQLQESR